MEQCPNNELLNQKSLNQKKKFSRNKESKRFDYYSSLSGSPFGGVVVSSTVGCHDRGIF